MSKSTDPHAAAVMYSLSELTAMMIKDQGIHVGDYELNVEIQVGVGAVGPDAQSPLPGAVIGISSIGIRKVDAPNPLSVDAAKVNPAIVKKAKASRLKID